MTGQPQPLGQLFPEVLADLVRRHGVEPPATLTNRRPQMTSPPILYWSPSLAEHAAATDGSGALIAGVIDATDGVFYRYDEGFWLVQPELPSDAVRLVCEPQAGAA